MNIIEHIIETDEYQYDWLATFFRKNKYSEDDKRYKIIVCEDEYMMRNGEEYLTIDENYNMTVRECEERKRYSVLIFMKRNLILRLTPPGWDNNTLKVKEGE